jgi:hypothetical protein
MKVKAMTKLHRRWVVFLATGDEHGWETRKFQHNQSLTNIICEHYDCTGSELPEVGYRPAENVRIDADYNSSKHAYSTHYRKHGDWVVTKVETFAPNIPIGNLYDEIAICSCEYSPIEVEMIPVPERLDFLSDKKLATV